MSELDRMLEVQQESQTIGEFLEWCNGRGMWLAQYMGNPTYREVLTPVGVSTEELLADFFEIDLNKAEQEKRAILAAIREDNT
jgi:hypothetical protein